MHRMVCGGQEVWTHCETDADGGSEGPWDEFALVELDQQRGLAHSAVPHEDGLHRVTERCDIMFPLLPPRLRPSTLCMGTWCRLLYMFCAVPQCIAQWSLM